MKVDRVIYYLLDGTWYYAAWCGSESDHSDVLDAETAEEAREELQEMFPGASLRRLRLGEAVL
jgi:hypothetical protein